MNLNFMRAEDWESKFIRAELCECEFYESRDFLSVNLLELSFANENFMRAEHRECEFYES